ncbi:MAG: methenyltetrahydromethanopterin cyclohydrolase [Planctomycetaceae bacterium]
MGLNEAAHGIAEHLIARAAALGVEVVNVAGVRVVDCGIRSAGSLDAGLLMAGAALAGLGDVGLLAAGTAALAETRLECSWPDCPWPVVAESSTAPVAACLAAQYAGWQVTEAGFFALASGPVRAAIGRERLYDVIGMRERPPVAVGLLETSRLPPEAACLKLAADAGVNADALTLLAARTASPAGTVQVVARALETALHKLHDLGFDVTRVRSGSGRAPLPPVPTGDDLAAIGRTNDAIRFGGHVILEVAGPEADLAAIGPRVVSQASPSHGVPFLELFERAGRDFYALDPALFAPALVDLVSVETGRAHRHGRIEPELVARSFGG